MTNAVNLATVGSNATSTGTLLTAGTAQASTSGTSIDFTGIPAWAKRVTVMFNGVSTNGTSLIWLQLGSGSVQTTGYTCVGTGFSSSGSTVTTTSAFVTTDTVRAADIRSGSAVFTLLGSNTWTLQGIFSMTTGITAISWFAGSVTLSGVLDRVRITTANGTDTFDAGSINILWE